MKLLLSLFVVFYLSRFSNGLVKELDMFNAVSGLLPNPSVPGVSKTTGFHSKSPALRFDRKTTDLIANSQVFNDIEKLIRESHDFIVSAYTKVDSVAARDNNPILSITSKDGQRIFFLVYIKQSDARQKLQVEFGFYSRGDLRTLSATTRKAIDITQWQKIELRVQDLDKMVRVFVDNEMVHVQRFDYTFDVIPSDAQLRLAQLYQAGQEGVGKIDKRFEGVLQDVIIRQGTKGDCSNPPTPAPCQCPKPGGNQCVMGGVAYKENDQWKKDNCTTCMCRNNQIICVYTCKPCSDGDKIYLNGDKWQSSKDKCETCRCELGTSKCALECPKLDCSGKSGRTITLPGACCSICIEDMCKGTDKVYKKCGCPKTCSNFRSNPSCLPATCKEGCFCPRGKLIDNDKCIAPAGCKCQRNGKTYESGKTLKDGCKWCICSFGNWNCMDNFFC